MSNTLETILERDLSNFSRWAERLHRDASQDIKGKPDLFDILSKLLFLNWRIEVGIAAICKKGIESNIQPDPQLKERIEMILTQYLEKGPASDITDIRSFTTARNLALSHLIQELSWSRSRSQNSKEATENSNSLMQEKALPDKAVTRGVERENSADHQPTSKEAIGVEEKINVNYKGKILTFHRHILELVAPAKALEINPNIAEQAIFQVPKGKEGAESEGISLSDKIFQVLREQSFSMHWVVINDRTHEVLASDPNEDEALAQARTRNMDQDKMTLIFVAPPSDSLDLTRVLL